MAKRAAAKVKAVASSARQAVEANAQVRDQQATAPQAAGETPAMTRRRFWPWLMSAFGLLVVLGLCVSVAVIGLGRRQEPDNLTGKRDEAKTKEGTPVSRTTSDPGPSGKEAEYRAAVRKAVEDTRARARELLPKAKDLQADADLLQSYLESLKAKDLRHWTNAYDKDVEVRAALYRLIEALELESHGAAINFHRLENIVAGPTTPSHVGTRREKEVKCDDKTIEITIVTSSHAAILALLEARRDDRLLLVLKKAGDPAQIVQRWDKVKSLYRELRDEALKMAEMVQDALPTVDNEGLYAVGGVTHLIEGDNFYLDNKVINIPSRYSSLYCNGRFGPNKAAISGYFKFKGNTTGKNAFGAAINIELYECDQGYSDSILLYRSVKQESEKFENEVQEWRKPGDGGGRKDDLKTLLIFYEFLIGKGTPSFRQNTK